MIDRPRPGTVRALRRRNAVHGIRGAVQLFRAADAGRARAIAGWHLGVRGFRRSGRDDAGQAADPRALHDDARRGTKLTFDWTQSRAAAARLVGLQPRHAHRRKLSRLHDLLSAAVSAQHGIIRNLEILSKKGTCVDVVEPAPTTGYASGAFDKVEAVTIACLAGPMSQRAALARLSGGRQPDQSLHGRLQSAHQEILRAIHLRGRRRECAHVQGRQIADLHALLQCAHDSAGARGTLVPGALHAATRRAPIPAATACIAAASRWCAK